MSLRLLIDEDSQAKHLVNLLQNAGHDVITVNLAGLMSKPDSVVLDYARQEDRVLINNADRNLKSRDLHSLVSRVETKESNKAPGESSGSGI